MEQVLYSVDGLSRRQKQHVLENREDEKLCSICLYAPKTHVLIPCGHLCVCAEDAEGLPHCPLCRSAVQSTHKVYL